MSTSTRNTLAALVAAIAVAVSLVPGAPVQASATPRAAAIVPADVTPADPTYSPASGPVFNNPLGTTDEQYAIVAALQRNIANSPPGSLIQLVTYSYVLQRVTDDLIAAHDRGVVVQAIIDNRSTRWSAATQLAAALDVDQTDASWVRFAKGSTRVKGGNTHQKTWRFSQVGASPWVTMVGSTNLSNPGNEDEWSDMWVWANRKDVWDTFNRVFQVQSTLSQAARPPYLSTTMGADSAYFLPMLKWNAKRDPVMQRLAAIRPRGANIRVAQYSWWGSRGVAIARSLAALRRGGAQVEAIIGPYVSPEVVGILRRAGVKLRNGVMPDGTHIHTKLMIASYVVNHRRRWTVWTGSDNWANESFGQDEAVVGIRGRGAWLLYTRHLATIPRLPL